HRERRRIRIPDGQFEYAAPGRVRDPRVEVASFVETRRVGRQLGEDEFALLPHLVGQPPGAGGMFHQLANGIDIFGISDDGEIKSAWGVVAFDDFHVATSRVREFLGQECAALATVATSPETLETNSWWRTGLAPCPTRTARCGPG